MRNEADFWLGLPFHRLDYSVKLPFDLLSAPVALTRPRNPQKVWQDKRGLRVQLRPKCNIRRLCSKVRRVTGLPAVIHNWPTGSCCQGQSMHCPRQTRLDAGITPG
jgi:hypothetical protein